MKALLPILAGGLAVAALGVTLAMAGEDGDAPGLSLIGIVLITGAFALGIRAAYRVGLTHGRQ